MASIASLWPWKKEQPGPDSVGSSKKEKPGNKTFRCFILQTGKTLNSHDHLMTCLKKRVPDLKEVHTVGESDIILVFCPVIRTPAIDINSAVETLNNISDTRPAVLVVLHYTFNPEFVVPNSRSTVTRQKTIMVNCLFHEDMGLLQCQKNQDSLDIIINYIIPQIRYKKSVVERMETDQSSMTSSSHSVSNKERTKPEKIKRKKENEVEPDKTEPLKCLVLQTGHTCNAHEVFINQLRCKIQLQLVDMVNACNFILAFCPIVSRAGTDLEAAVKRLNLCSADKPAVLVVLHHTFDPGYVPPDSSRFVHRMKTITVDCLFYENQGLLQCKKNNESFTKIIRYIKPQIQPIISTDDGMETDPTTMPPRKKTWYFHFKDNTENPCKVLMDSLKKNENLEEVESEDNCDFILTFSSDLFNGTDIQSSSSENDDVPTHSPNLFNPQLGPELETTQEQGACGVPHCSDKQENMLKEVELCENKHENMKIELQNKERELEKMRIELAEKDKLLKSLQKERERDTLEMWMWVEEKDREITQAETHLGMVKAELVNTTKDLEEKKKELANVSQLLNEGIEVVENSKITLDSVGKKMKNKNRQIQEMNKSLPNSANFL